MKKSIIVGTIIFLFFTVFAAGAFLSGLLPNQNIEMSDSIVVKPAVPEFTDDMTVQEMQSEMFRTYRGDITRLSSVVVEDIADDHLSVRIDGVYQGEQPATKKIYMSDHMAVVIHTLGMHEERLTREELGEIKKGDRITVECIKEERENESGALVAMLVIKDAFNIPIIEPEVEEDLPQ
jgi:hypothetical protein